ncbi:uncharacterized protein LOC144090555 isoform X1 [Stigmatopora argus]
MSQVSLPAEGGERHQEYVCGTRTSIHSAVGAYSTVCAKGPTHTPTKLRPAKYFRCLSRRRRERHQEYVCGTRTSFHSAVGAYSTVCAKGPTHTPTKLRPAKYFREKLEEAGNLINYLLYGKLVLYY